MYDDEDDEIDDWLDVEPNPTSTAPPKSLLLEFKFNIDVERDDAGNICGITVTPQKQDEAKSFCDTFCAAWDNREAQIRLDLVCKQLMLINEKCPFQPGLALVRIEPKDFSYLKRFSERTRRGILVLKSEQGFQILFY